MAPRPDEKPRQLQQVARKFLKNHPEAKKALELFGIADEQYERFVAAQHQARFYTSNSTIEGGPHGELD